MKSIFDKLQSLSQSRLLSEAEMAHLVKMNTLYRIGAITHNELRIGLGGESIGAAGDRFAPEEERVFDRP
jgi:hypothetical protein